MDTNVRTGVKNWCELLPFFGEFRSHSDWRKDEIFLGGAMESFD